jgi:hypothetical protein
VTGQADRWIRLTTTGCVAFLALIASTVSYLHMHLLVELHGQPGWVAALTPLSVDGMIVASTTLLAESRSGGRGGMLPWALLVIGSVASLAANVAVAEPTATGRVIAAWPSFALIASYELLMRQVRRAAEAGMSRQRSGGSEAGQKARNRLVGSVSGCLMPGEGRPGAAGKRSSWHGSGRWPTSPVTAPCPPAGTSAASMAGTSDGADWSNGQDWLANWTRRPSRRSDTPPVGALSVPTTGASSHAGDAGSHRRILRTRAATRRLRLASRARPQPRRWVCLPECRHGRGAYAGEFALASCALAVPGEDEGACPQERFGTLG